MSEAEIWKEIPGFDRYEVSNLERLKYSNGRIRDVSGDKPLEIGIRNDKGKRVKVLFSRLVAFAFVANPENLPCVLHINGKSNVPENLRWGAKGEEGKNKNIVRPKVYNVVPIERLDSEGKVLETYTDRASMVKWVRENCNVRAKKDYVIEWKIGEVCNGNRNSAYGYDWRYEYKEIKGEGWKKHPNEKFDEYEFSTMGRCRKGKRLMMGSINKKGYVRVADQFLHRLIAQTFLENPDDLPEVNHWNEIKADNRVCNLEWSTPGDNTRHSHNKIIYQYTKDRKTFIKEFESVKKASDETKVTGGNIARCARGKRKTAGGYYWSYVNI